MRYEALVKESRLKSLGPLGNVIYLLPPYCTTEEQLAYAYDSIEAVLDEI